MPNWIVTYDDVIEADTEEEARKRLVRVLESDVACNDTSAFKFKIHYTCYKWKGYKT